MNTKNHTFLIEVFGNYYKDDVEFTIDISLSDTEVDVIQSLVSQCDELYKHSDLMPILEAGAPELHQRFFNVIYPRVFFELFDLDSVDLSSSPDDWGRQWDFARDIDYLLATYGDAVDVSDAFTCCIPDEFRQKKT